MHVINLIQYFYQVIGINHQNVLMVLEILHFFFFILFPEVISTCVFRIGNIGPDIMNNQ